MKPEIMRDKIGDMLVGIPTKFRNGGKYALISPKQESQLFNTLHRDYGAMKMNLSRVQGNEIRILVQDWDYNVIIDSTIFTY